MFGYKQTGAITRRQAIEIASQQFNVQTKFGAKLDGTTDDTDAFVGAIAAAKAVGAQTYGGRAAAIYVPQGLGIVSGIDLDDSVQMFGAGTKASALRLKAGSNRSLIKVPPRPAGGDSYPATMEYSRIGGISLDGNNAEQSGTSYVIECPDSAFPLTTQYNRSIVIDDDVAADFGRSGGIYLGENRNWARLGAMRSWYNTGPALTSFGYDHRFTDCDFSGLLSSTQPVINIVSGGSHSFKGVNAYLSGGEVLVISQYVNSYVDFDGCAFDAAQQRLAYIACGGTRRPITFKACRFHEASGAGAGVWPFIQLVDPVEDDVLFVKCSPTVGAGPKPNRIIQSNVAYAVNFDEISWNEASPPFTVEPYSALIFDRSQRARPKRLVIFGSSNAAGQGATGYGAPSLANGWASAPTSWAGLLAAELGASWKVINRSVAGYNSTQNLNRFWTDVAPHKPSHVFICSGPANDSYDPQVFYRNTAIMVGLCKLIGAVPIVRGAYPHNAMTSGQYETMKAMNQQLENLGCRVVDHMAILDDGTGHFVGGATYHVGDGQHPNDAGYAVQFSAIDIGLFTADDGEPFNRPSGAWRINSGVTTEPGIEFGAAQGLAQNTRSFTMRARVKGVSGVAAAKAFLCAYVYGVGSTPLRLRNGSGPYDIADTSGTAVVVSAVNPTSDFTTHEVVIVYKHTTGLAYLYIDGVLIGSGTPAGTPGVVTRFAVGSRPDAVSGCAAGYAFSGVAIWNVPLSARDIADMARTGNLPQGGLMATLDFSSAPVVSGVAPSGVRNGLLPVLGANWLANAAI